jgi:hypothetical protein
MVKRRRKMLAAHTEQKERATGREGLPGSSFPTTLLPVAKERKVCTRGAVLQINFAAATRLSIKNVFLCASPSNYKNDEKRAAAAARVY